MKHPFHCNILPYFTMGAGGLGLALRLWLFSAVDEKGLLPKDLKRGVLSQDAVYDFLSSLKG